ncbi:transcriptional regulator [Microbacterium bovistercoris]|uniref:Transcriptional regulator n=1 Tax=Microbacterium bovistercoris TaxID=2293570 RepID=A0A371NRP8_9MICO|nr:AAA family ATPase [Microbacterium bovistercoris]REJ04848.1 transcriptional regulator [Microbacterium bovistercoris]
MASAKDAPAVAPGAPRLHLHLLGGFRASRDDGPPLPEQWTRPGARTLVKLLAVAPGHRLHRDEIIAVCWPDATPEAAQRSLGVALHAARRALEPELAARQPSSYLTTDAALLRLETATVEIDADQAEALAAAALADGGVPELTAAATALAGDLLPEDRYAEWSQPLRRRLAEARTRVQLQLADALLDAGRTEESVAAAREALSAYPAEERAHRTIMRAYLSQGLRRQAIHQYHACREALDDELGVRPGPQTEALHLQALDVRHPGANRSVDGAVLPPPVLRTPPASPLRGRDAIVARLAADDAPAVLLVTGEAGIGKTRVVTEAARRMLDAGSFVLWGAARDADAHTPYGAVVEALDGWLAGRPAAERARVGGEYPELAALLPSLGSASPTLQRSPDDERRRLFLAADALLGDLSATAPVLLVLDDLHTADLGTVQLLSSLARRATATGARWRAIATFRDDELVADDARRGILDGLQHDGVAAEVAVPRLDREDCRALALDIAGDAVADRVWQLSLGHPLFAIELAREAGDLGTRSPGSSGVRPLVAARLARLPLTARRVAEVVAIAGGEAAVSEVIDVATHALHPPLSNGEAAEAVDAALNASVLFERDLVIDGRPVPGLVFQHPLVRLTAYDELSQARRQVLHGAFADVVLRRRPHAVDTLATHLSRADDPRSTTYLRQAAERAAALSANDTADLYYSELISRLDAVSAEAAWVRLERSVILQRTGRFDEALAVLTEALGDLRRRDDDDGVVLATARMAEVLISTASPHDALATLDTAPVSAGSGALAATTHHLARTRALLVTGRYSDAVDFAARAQQTAGQVPEQRRGGLIARALQFQAVSLALAGRVAEAGPVADEALPHAEAYGDPQILASVLSVRREQARRSGRLHDALAMGRQALELAERSGERLSQAFEQANLAELHLLVDEVDVAAELADAACTAPPDQAGLSTPYALVSRALVLIRREQDPSAVLDEAQRAAEASADRQAIDEAGRARATWLIETGAYDEALRVLGGLTRGSATAEAWAHLGLGDAAAAAELSAAEIARSATGGELLSEVDARIAHAAALAAQGLGPRADEEFAEAEELATRLPYPAALVQLARARARR